jgi:hypothetical protein
VVALALGGAYFSYRRDTVMRFSKLVVSVAVCALGALGGGCSGSDGGAATVGPVTLDQYPQAYANALCDTLAPCCKAANLTYTESACKSAATDDWSQFIAASSGAHTRYDADAAGRCIAAVKNGVASCKPNDDEDAAAQAACSSVFIGTIAVGSACTSSADCIAPATCQNDPSATSFNAAGVCTAPGVGVGASHAAAGAPCVSTCDDRDGGGLCQNFGPEGGGICYTSDGLFCPFDTQVCAAFGKLGEACSVQENSCVSGAYCNGGTCAAQVDSGPCDMFNNACSAKSYCDLGQCFAKKADHFGCTTDGECASGVCAQTTANTSQGTCGVPSLATPERCSGQPASTQPQGI